MTSKKITIVGDGGVGKSTFVKKHLTGTFETKYVPTLGVDVHPYDGHGRYQFKYNLWDTAGQEKFSGLDAGYYIGADGAIVMFDLTSNVSFKNIETWISKIHSTCGNIPIIVCGNKSDLTGKVIDQSDIEQMIKKNKVSYSELSVRTGCNHHKIFEHFDDIFGYVMV